MQLPDELYGHSSHVLLVAVAVLMRDTVLLTVSCQPDTLIRHFMIEEILHDLNLARVKRLPTDHFVFLY